MHDKHSNLLSCYMITICLLFTFLAVGSAMAQQAASTPRAVKMEAQQQTKGKGTYAFQGTAKIA